jgi:hypothetical protein
MGMGVLSKISLPAFLEQEPLFNLNKVYEADIIRAYE